MIAKIFFYITHPCVFIIFSLVLLHLEATTTNQNIAVGGEENDANGAIKKCSDEERHTLLNFKSHLQDTDGFLSTWRDEEDDCCRWRGVTCNTQTGHVTRLEVGPSGLVGKISHSLLNLTYLNHLDLSHNYLYGTIPTFIGSMTLLRYLNLAGNNLNGTIPRSIGSLTELSFLDLSYLSLYGTIPLELGNLTNLQVLSLGFVGRCRVENIKWLSHLSGLQTLNMDGISLDKANHWVNVISSFRNLSYLSLRGCELSKVMYPYSSFVNSSSSIVFLDLGNNSLNSSMYHWLFSLTSNSLFELDLSYNMLDGIPKYLGNLSNLEVLKLENNSAVIKFPDFLKNLSGCSSLTLAWLYASRSHFTGSLSDDIQNFSSLEFLYLSENQLNGTISEKLWELPMLGIVDVSFNYLRGGISEKIGNSKIFVIDLSRNSLDGVPSTDNISSLSYVEHIDLSSCKLGPRFPKWIQTLKNLTNLDISNTGISDTIPLEFWNMWPSRLHHLNLSSNNISGKVPDLLSSFDDNPVIDLSSNRFYGPIPNFPSTLKSLNLSRNKFFGGISFLCQLVHGYLEFLDLSHNFLAEQLPDCLWHFKELKVLNLGYNNLFGRLPTSIESLFKLEVLYLYNNDFSGELPLSLKNCTSLTSLNLGVNKFSGNVPIWIGENLSGLYVLILRSNNFFGTIPSQLCQLAYLQVLDMSMNNLHGIIPSCLDNLTSMVQEGFSEKQNIQKYSSTKNTTGVVNLAYNGRYVDNAMIKWQGDEREFINNLRLLKSIDLSSNNLTGQIPYELTNLFELLALNLSHNALFGEIPWKIGQMKKLLTLDLSRNNFSGGIPISMSQVTLLSYLDVSFNNLSGRIPSSTQLQSFEPSRYNGNKELCGPPITKICPGDEELEVPPVIGESEGGGNGISELWRWFYIGGVTGFATGFWIACGALLVNNRGRHAFFHFLDSFKDQVYVNVVVFVVKLQRVVRA
ncbi:receptor-like protein EIX2 [Lactuca sativa]|nr:receptor-like protein EIX2 [Lactuca sativa]